MQPQKLKRSLIISTFAMVIAISNYLTLVKDHHVRAVEFVSILAIGMLLGIIVVSLILLVKTNRSQAGEKV